MTYSQHLKMQSRSKALPACIHVHISQPQAHVWLLKAALHTSDPSWCVSAHMLSMRSPAEGSARHTGCCRCCCCCQDLVFMLAGCHSRLTHLWW